MAEEFVLHILVVSFDVRYIILHRQFFEVYLLTRQMLLVCLCISLIAEDIIGT